VGHAAVKAWYLVHKWTSLVCTLFLLMTCLTGLPLIFHEELEDALGYNAPLEQVAAGTPRPSLDSIARAALAARPGEVIQYLAFDEERPVVTVGTAPTAASPPNTLYNQPVDLRTGKFVAPPPQNKGVVWFLEELHIRMFAGLPGTLFLGAMGVLFLVAVVSGVVVYAPFMRKLPYGTLRRDRSARLKWLDLHNVTGISITAWLAVVGFTGVFNTLDVPLATEWKNGQLAEMVAPYRNAPPPTRLGSIDAALAAALKASPGMKPSSISFPGSFFATPHHYNVFLLGSSPVTSRLLKPALVNAQTGQLTDTRDMPLHIRALFLSRPLHFGDYGGLLLKLVWAGLDILAVVVLVSGLVLWAGRRRAPLERRVDEMETGGLVGETAA
jgi:uncharacterized iron-regulated membrane protein